MHIVSVQVEDIINCKPNEHDHCDGFILAELLAIPLHKADDAKNDHGNAPNREETCNQVPCH